MIKYQMCMCKGVPTGMVNVIINGEKWENLL